MHDKLLVVGQLPPPVHGSTVMTNIFMEALKNLGEDTFIVQKTFTKTMKEIEKITIRKILIVPFIGFKIVYSILINRPKKCFYFASVKPPSLYVDLLFIFMIQLLKCKIVLYLHGKGYEKVWLKIGIIQKFILKNVFSKCSGAIVLGKNLRSDIYPFFKNNKIYILPNCIPENKNRNTQNKLTKNNPKKVLFLSNLISTKGPIEFLKMAKYVKKRNKNVKFILAGSAMSNDPITYKIKDYINDSGLVNSVHRIEAVYGNDKDKLFNECDIFVFPTYYELECFPLVNLEAMRASLPVISTNQGSIPEAIIDGVNGYIINPKNISEFGDRVLELLNNDNLRLQMGNMGRKFFENKYTMNSYELNLKKAIYFFDW